MRTRKFQQRDAKQVSKLMRAAFRSFLGKKYTQDIENELAPSVLAKTSVAKSRFSQNAAFVVVDGPSVVGYVRISAAGNGLGSLHIIGVDPAWFGQGIGELLMTAAERFWSSKKQRKITTCVSSTNQRALIYYIRHGFVPEGYCKDHFIPGVDEVMLGRFL